MVDHTSVDMPIRTAVGDTAVLSLSTLDMGDDYGSGGGTLGLLNSEGSTSGATKRSVGLLGRLRNSRTFTLGLFATVVVLLFSDQNLMAPNLSAIAKEFEFSDEVCVWCANMCQGRGCFFRVTVCELYFVVHVALLNCLCSTLRTLHSVQRS